VCGGASEESLPLMLITSLMLTIDRFARRVLMSNRNYDMEEILREGGRGCREELEVYDSGEELARGLG
jgi:hypothetical protein